jgi:hypothetical protein
VPNAIKGREGTELVIFGMEGIPEEYLDAWQGGKGPAGTGSDSEGESAKRPRLDGAAAGFNVGPFGTMRPPWMPGAAAPPGAPGAPPSFSPALMRPVYPTMPMPPMPMPMPMGMPPGMMAPPPPMPPYPGMPGYPPPFMPGPGGPGYPAPPPGWPGAPWGMPMPPMHFPGPPGTGGAPLMPTSALPAAAPSDPATAAAAAAAAVVAAAAGAAPPSAALAVAAAAVAATVAPVVPSPAATPAPDPAPAPSAPGTERLVYDDNHYSMVRALRSLVGAAWAREVLTRPRAHQEERRAMLERYRWVPPAL